MGLVQDLYAAHKDNQTFRHSHFGLGEDVLKPYKETLERRLWPDVMRNQEWFRVCTRESLAAKSRPRSCAKWGTA